MGVVAKREYQTLAEGQTRRACHVVAPRLKLWAALQKRLRLPVALNESGRARHNNWPLIRPGVPGFSVGLRPLGMRVAACGASCCVAPALSIIRRGARITGLPDRARGFATSTQNFSGGWRCCRCAAKRPPAALLTGRTSMRIHCLRRWRRRFAGDAEVLMISVTSKSAGLFTGALEIAQAVRGGE